MILLLKLFLAHILGDFVFQPDTWVADKLEKKIKSPKLYLHILVHVVLTSLLLMGENFDIGIVFIIAITHYIIDLCKLYLQNEKNKRLLFGLDQLLHVLVLVTVSFDIHTLMNTIMETKVWNSSILLIASMVMITTVSSQVIKILISKWTPENEDTDEDSLSNAGSYIGMLERLFVFGFVITGNTPLVGFLLAAKSVFRFGDLKDSKDRKLTEYILIGTLLSFGIAIMIALVYLKIKTYI